VSPDTVKQAAKRMRWKLGAKNNIHAMALAYHFGILTPRISNDRA